MTLCLDSQTQHISRKKPAGQLVSQTAHQVEREYTVLAATRKQNSRPTTPPESPGPVSKIARSSERLSTSWSFSRADLHGHVDARRVPRGSVRVLAHTSRTSRPSFLIF
ncbi:hypothetical protein EDB92DRAFT_1355586 [Lactarius akahatsu]|uniref:Uncharacterized protein n=1 Tax=Lactarius akahatsu TaxID=416441 RepID=A0AAD4LBE4_9AGAM|nr:hypothetical protein EDB92DRAFT_1355586 [Lactarius akahatsu]